MRYTDPTKTNLLQDCRQNRVYSDEVYVWKEWKSKFTKLFVFIIFLFFIHTIYSKKKSNQKHVDEENKVDWRKASPNTEPNGTR